MTNYLNTLGLRSPRGLTYYQAAGPQVAAGAILAFAVSIFLLWQDQWLFQGWGELFPGLAALLGHEQLEVVLSRNPELLVNVYADSRIPGMAASTTWALSGAVALWLASHLLRKAGIPVVYILRALSLVAGLPALGALVLGYAPDFNMNAHIAGVFKLGFWFLVCAPVVLALTAFTLPGNFVKKGGVLVLAVSYFYVFIPVLALFHLVVLRMGGAAFLPALNIIFSVITLSAQLVAFYGWMASIEESV